MKKARAVVFSSVLLAGSVLGAYAEAADDVPVFRSVHDCNIDFNPVLSRYGLGTLTTVKIRGQEHTANTVPAKITSAQGERLGFYVLTDDDHATFVETPVTSNSRVSPSLAGPSHATQAQGSVDRQKFYSNDPINGAYEVEMSLSCSARYEFRDEQGTPTHPVKIEHHDGVLAGGAAIPGTCRTILPRTDVVEAPPRTPLSADHINRHADPAAVNSAALSDLQEKLKNVMERIAANITAPGAAKSRYPDAQIESKMGVTGAQERANACHALRTFFNNYNECGTRSLPNRGGRSSLDGMSQQDSQFGDRLRTLRQLYDNSFRGHSDTPECNGPIIPPAAVPADGGGSGSGGVSNPAHP